MTGGARQAGLAVLGFGVFFAAWQVSALSGAGAGAIPELGELVGAAAGLLSTDLFWAAITNTLLLWLSGMVAVILLAVPLGIIIGSSSGVREYTISTIDFFRSLPTVALLPIALIILGSGTSMVVFMVVFAALWPLLIQTIAGIDAVDPVTLDTAKVMHLSWRERIWHILMPGAMPYVATGLRISASLALILVVVSGMLAGSAGVGRSLIRAEEGFRIPELYLYVLACGVLGIIINTVFSALERRTLAWQTAGASQ